MSLVFLWAQRCKSCNCPQVGNVVVFVSHTALQRACATNKTKQRQLLQHAGEPPSQFLELQLGRWLAALAPLCTHRPFTVMSFPLTCVHLAPCTLQMISSG